jgi:imidazolonepropionase-like amidohydrolase
MRRAALPALLLLLGAQPEPAPLAFKGGTLVAAPGAAPVADAVVLVRNGLIEAAGAGLAIPPDAQVVDAKGLTIYSGFIDARSTLGLGDTRRAADGDKPDLTKEAPPRMDAANRKGIRPETDAAVLVRVDEEAARKHQAGGFTLARIALADEYLGGRAALLSLSGRPRREALVAGAAGSQGGLKTAGEGYPNTAMGVMAHLRQTLSDARNHAELRKAWKPGTPRPPVDPSLEALAGSSGVLYFDADGELEIRRALALAAEFGIAAGFSGGAEAHKVAALLHERRVPVLLSLKNPKAPVAEEHEPLRLREERQRLYRETLGRAAALERAKVDLAFSSAGLASPEDAFEAVAALVEHGLSRDGALAALTTAPARLFGLEATHGKVEKGYTGNLSVLTQPLGDRKARLKWAVVDGRLFEHSPKTPEDKKDEKKEPPAAADFPVELDADRKPRHPPVGGLFIKDAVVHTVGAEGSLAKASIHVLNGRIAAVGSGLPVPEGAEVIGAAGLHAMPGIVDAHSHIAMDGGVNETTSSITCEVCVTDILDPYDVEVHRAAAGGVTAALILHGSANAIGGQSATIRMRYGVSPEELRFPGAPRGVKFALGENPKQSNFPANKGKRFPNTRMGVEAVFRRAFAEAKEYRGGRPDLRLEALRGILRGEILVHCHCYRADEIAMILGIAKEHGLKIATLQHVLEGYRVMPEIRALGAGASTFSDWWAYKVEAYEAIPHNASMMQQAGILTSINSDLPHQIRHLALEASKTMKYGGLSSTEAMAQVTINPARQLGIGELTGTIEAGKRADLALWTGHPLSTYSRCVFTLVDGIVVWDARERAPRNGTPDFDPGKRLRRPTGPLPAGDVVAVRGARIHPVTAPPFTGTIVISKGKITALGPDVAVPAGASEIVASGLSVYPGIIDAWTGLGLMEIGSVAGTRDDSEIGLIQPDLKALMSVHPHSELIPVTRANGVTSALTRPEGGLIAGQSALIRLDGSSPEEMKVREPVALHVDLPQRPKDDDAEGKKEHERRTKLLRETFDAAKRHQGTGKDLKLEALQPFLKGERPVILTASKARDIRDALKFAEDYGLKAVIAGGLEAWKVAPELAKKKVPVIVVGTMGIPHEKHDVADAVAANPAKLHAAGVRFAISSDEAFHGNPRNTPYHAAWAAAHGLDREEALRSVTLRPAEILGAADRLGSLEVGKDADLIVTTGDPLETVTDVVWVFIAGRAVPLETKHTRLYDRFKSRK